MTRGIALGGSAANPNAGQGCSGYLIESEEARLVLDLGPGTLIELLRHADIGALDGIVITHMHIDHMLDLIALWWGWMHHPRQLERPLPLWLPPDGAAKMRRTLSTLGRTDEVDRFFGDVCDVNEFAPDDPLESAGATLTFARTSHFIPCWAIRCEMSNVVVTYTADTGRASDLVNLARNADLLIAESMSRTDSFDESEFRGTSTPVEAATLARDAGVKRLMLTHFSLPEDAEIGRRQAAEVFSGSIDVAVPGLTIEL